MSIYRVAIFGFALLATSPAFAQFKPDPYPDDGPRQRQEWNLEQMASACNDHRDWTPGPWQQTTNGAPYFSGWENCASVMRVLRRMWTEDADTAKRQDQNHTEQMRQAIEEFRP